MNQSTSGKPLWDEFDVELPPEERRRLRRVDALLRAVAARDRRVAIEPSELQAVALAGFGPAILRSRTKW